MHDRLVVYDSLRCAFMRVKKPPKQPNCPVCSQNATIRSMEDSRKVSQSARGPSCPIDKGKQNLLYIPPPIPEQFIISCSEYNQIRNDGSPHVLLDVRVKEQFDLCSLEGAINIPLATLEDELERVEKLSNSSKPVFCICRRGIFSVSAAKTLIQAAGTHPRIHLVKHIEGGLEAWREKVDSSFPKY
jgi:adenylyltransferase/sulfurtransferase